MMLLDNAAFKRVVRRGQDRSHLTSSSCS